jgi:heme oxygenase (mycobilin-producing)
MASAAQPDEARERGVGVSRDEARESEVGFVALSRFVIANGMAAEVKAAFRNRPHLVDGVSGYVRMDVVSPLDVPEELWLITFWTDQASFDAWHHSHLYRGSHAGIPRGLKLVPAETQIRRFEHVAS